MTMPVLVCDRRAGAAFAAVFGPGRGSARPDSAWSDFSDTDLCEKIARLAFSASPAQLPLVFMHFPDAGPDMEGCLAFRLTGADGMVICMGVRSPHTPPDTDWDWAAWDWFRPECIARFLSSSYVCFINGGEPVSARAALDGLSLACATARR